MTRWFSMNARRRPIPENARTFIIAEVVRNISIIKDRVEEFHMTRESYARSTMYQDLLTMPMLRICEAVSEYTAVFEEIEPSYPWKDIAKMRSKIAHPYGGFDFDFIWEVMESDLSELEKICRAAIS